MAKDSIKIFNQFGELVRTYTEEETDERSDYTEKAKEFLSKHEGYTTDGEVAETTPLGAAAPKSKDKVKAPAAPKSKE